MLRGAGRFAGLVGAVVLVACATGYPAGMAGTATPAFNGVRDSDGTTSLDEDELHADGRNLLDVLQQRLPNMTVSQDGDCPEVNLRGKSLCSMRPIPPSTLVRSAQPTPAFCSH